MDRCSSSPVKSSSSVGPSLGIPHPVRDRVVHEAGPKEGKDQERKESSLFCNDSCHERGTEQFFRRCISAKDNWGKHLRESSKHALKEPESHGRNSR
jgi:hypothetical protein